MKRPNFFIVGAPKSGTSALSQYIAEHNNGFLCAWKEPNYFTTDFPSHRLARTERQYLSLYAKADRHHTAIGEASVWYLYSQTAAENIHHFDPDAKIIIMLRNPVTMIQSLHQQMVRDFAETETDFARAIELEPERRAGKLPERRYKVYDPRTYLYTEVGKYAQQVQRYLDVFPHEQVKIIIFDDFAADTQKVYEETLDFLGLPQDGRTEFPRINVRETYRWPRVARIMFDFWQTASSIKRRLDIVYPLGIWPMLRWFSAEPAPRPQMDPDLRHRLEDTFRDDVIRLSHMLGRDLTHWIGDDAELDVSASPDITAASPAVTPKPCTETQRLQPSVEPPSTEKRAATPHEVEDKTADDITGSAEGGPDEATPRRPLRIIYTMAEDLGGQKGSCQHFCSVVKGLQKLGHKVFVAAPNFKLPAGRRDLGDARLFVALPARRMMFLTYQVLLAMLLPIIAIVWRPDVLMIRALPGMYWLPALVARLLGLRVVVEVNGIPWEEMHSRGLPNSAKWVAHRTMRLLCRCANRVISVTSGIGEELQRLTGMNPQRFFTVQNAAWPEELQGGDRAGIRRQLGLTDEDFVVGFIGTFDIWHGTNELVASIDKLDEDVRERIVYVLAGDGEYRRSTEEAARKYGNKVRFPGPIVREHVRDWLAAFDIGVFVTHDQRKRRYGTSPLKFWEYLAAGLPVLVTDDPNLSRIVREHDMGIVVPDATDDQLAGAISLACRQNNLLSEAGGRNADWMQLHWSWLHACKGIIRAILE